MNSNLTLFSGDLLMSIALKIQQVTTFNIFKDEAGTQTAVNTRHQPKGPPSYRIRVRAREEIPVLLAA